MLCVYLDCGRHTTPNKHSDVVTGGDWDLVAPRRTVGPNVLPTSQNGLVRKVGFGGFVQCPSVALRIGKMRGTKNGGNDLVTMTVDRLFAGQHVGASCFGDVPRLAANKPFPVNTAMAINHARPWQCRCRLSDDVAEG